MIARVVSRGNSELEQGCQRLYWKRIVTYVNHGTLPVIHDQEEVLIMKRDVDKQLAWAHISETAAHTARKLSLISTRRNRKRVFFYMCNFWNFC